MEKLQKEEFNKIKNAIQLENELSSRLGSVEYKLNELKNTKKELLKAITKTLDNRKGYLAELRKKYNIETLNIDTGEFTVTK
tara:strand:+ start:66 stop:311 length:246 start_codon:yes stop_codon:yes gene_type:complete